VSIITPSYNQGDFLEETIRSILLQGYPNLEYIILDAGSTDNSVEILKKYSPWLAYWCSEKDAGQADAINKGLRRATGDIIAYLNSDDWYFPGAVAGVVSRFLQHPDERWWVGWVDYVSTELRERKLSSFTSLECFLGRRETIFQPGTFWHRDATAQVGFFDKTLDFAFDLEYWARMRVAGFQLANLDLPIANFRLHGSSKTCSFRHQFQGEFWDLARRYRSSLSSSQWTNTCRGLNELESDYMIDNAYALMVRKKRWEAVAYLLGRISLWPLLKEKRTYLGALARGIVTGQPPAWFNKA